MQLFMYGSGVEVKHKCNEPLNVISEVFVRIDTFLVAVFRKQSWHMVDEDSSRFDEFVQVNKFT